MEARRRVAIVLLVALSLASVVSTARVVRGDRAYVAYLAAELLARDAARARP